MTSLSFIINNLVIFKKSKTKSEDAKDWKKSGIARKFPSYRSEPLVTIHRYRK